jgi:5-methylcytosine-specific restriction protein A
LKVATGKGSDRARSSDSASPRSPGALRLGVALPPAEPGYVVASSTSSFGRVAVFLLTWNPVTNPAAGDGFSEWAASASGPHGTNWSTGSRRTGIVRGDTAYLVRQIRERGIVAKARFVSAPYEDRHWADPSKTAYYAGINLETYLEPADRLDIDTLRAVIGGVRWDNLYGSGVEVKGADVQALDALWQEHLAGLEYGARAPQEVVGQTFSEGDVKRVPVNRYERDPRARAACLAAQGTTCVVCGFDFGVTYGPLGDGFIHVHHVRELSALPAGYLVDPAKDLVPVCPNCHAMLHMRRPAMHPEELRRHL